MICSTKLMWAVTTISNFFIQNIVRRSSDVNNRTFTWDINSRNKFCLQDLITLQLLCNFQWIKIETGGVEYGVKENVCAVCLPKNTTAFTSFKKQNKQRMCAGKWGSVMECCQNFPLKLSFPLNLIHDEGLVKGDLGKNKNVWKWKYWVIRYLRLINNLKQVSNDVQGKHIGYQCSGTTRVDLFGESKSSSSNRENSQF